MDFECVLDDYRNGDEDERISLFLAYRDFRDKFSRIEQELETKDLIDVLKQYEKEGIPFTSSKEIARM